MTPELALTSAVVILAINIHNEKNQEKNIKSLRR